MTTSSALLLAAAMMAPAAEPSIDSILQAAWSEAGVTPAAGCSDEQFLRRVTLDLAGRIPTVEEQLAFRRSGDRAAKIDQLLDGEEFSRFQAELWSSILIGFDDGRLRGSRALLTDWLFESLQARKPWNQVAQELIAAEGESAFHGPVNFLLAHPDEPVAKVCRVFLGVRLDCARCHDHPFDRWTQDDFQGMSRFFQATRRREVSRGNVRLESFARQVAADQRPRFLTGSEPRTSRWRDEFALFTVRSRPFARAFANRLWYQLFGRGLVDPVDDFNADNPPASRALLEHLADEARRSNFDVRSMIRQICNSRAWQQSSQAGGIDAQQLEQRRRLFAVQGVRPLTPQQLINSYAQVWGRPLDGPRRQELLRQLTLGARQEDVSQTWRYRESVQELMFALAGKSPQLRGNLEQVFQRLLSRPPTPQEVQLCKSRAAADVAFALMHSNEFRFNH